MFEQTALQFLNVPTLVTLMGTALSLAACLAVITSQLTLAMVCLIQAGVCDMLDGQIARRMQLSESARSFGKELDAVADAIAFGITPALIAHGLGLRTWLDGALLAGYACAAVLRLAYFNVQGLQELGARSYYTGLPVTYVALAMPLLHWSLPELSINGWRCMMFTLAVLFLAPLRVRKPGPRVLALFMGLAAVASVSMLRAAP